MPVSGTAILGIKSKAKPGEGGRAAKDPKDMSSLVVNNVRQLWEQRESSDFQLKYVDRRGGCRVFCLHTHLFQSSDYIVGMLPVVNGAARSSGHSSEEELPELTFDVREVPTLSTFSDSVLGAAVTAYLSLHYSRDVEPPSKNAKAGFLAAVCLISDYFLDTLALAYSFDRFDEYASTRGQLMSHYGFVYRILFPRYTARNTPKEMLLLPDLSTWGKYDSPDLAARLEDAFVVCDGRYMSEEALEKLTYNFFRERKNVSFWGGKEVPGYIPPPQMTNLSPWVSGRKEMQQRFDLLVGKFFEKVGWTKNMYVSGSIIPCVCLQFCYPLAEPESYLEYVCEVYDTLDLDIFLLHDADVDGYIERIADQFPDMVELDHPHTWNKTQRNSIRYFKLNDSLPKVKINVYPRETSMLNIASRHHFSFLRCWMDRCSNVFLTARCLFSWKTRLVSGPLYFYPEASSRKRSILVLKWAMRGFGFSNETCERYNIRFPSAIDKWLFPYRNRYNLPWYHPLYNPNRWGRVLSAESIAKLKNCDNCL